MTGTLERHSIYFVPPRSSAAAGSSSSGEPERADDSQESQEQRAQQQEETVVRLRILANSSAYVGSSASSRPRSSKSHFVSWRVSAPSIKTVGTQQYALSTRFPALSPPSASFANATLSSPSRAALIADVKEQPPSSSTGAVASSSGSRCCNCCHRRASTSTAASESDTKASRSRSKTSPARSSASTRSPSKSRIVAAPTTRQQHVGDEARSGHSSPVARSPSEVSAASSLATNAETDTSSASVSPTTTCCSCANGCAPASSTSATQAYSAASHTRSRSSSLAGRSEVSSSVFSPMKSSVASPHSTASARFNFEREYESVLVANAVQPQPASNRKVSAVERQPACLAPGSGQGYTAVPLLTDTPGLRLGKPAEDDIFAVTRTNSNLLRRKDLQWYLDKTLWKLGVHKKARRDFMAYWLPRFTNEEFVAVRFVPEPSFSPQIPFEHSVSPSTVLVSVHRVFCLFRRVSVPETSGWTYTVRGGSSTHGVIDWAQSCAMPEDWAKDDTVPLLLEIGALDTGGRSYFFD